MFNAMYLLLGIFVIAFPVMGQTTVTGYLQNFNDGNIDYWSVDAEQQITFQVSADDNALRINYTRTALSYQWDNFHFYPPFLTDLNANSLIAFRIKSTVKTVLAVKPVFDDTSSLWLTKTINGDSVWRTVTFSVSASTNKKLTRIYCYLDGGTTTPISGVVHIDDFQLGDSVSALDLSRLLSAISATQTLIASTVEGPNEGQFPNASKSVLQGVLTQATAVATGGTKQQSIVDNAERDLYDACVNYEKQVYAVKLPLVDSLSTKETRYLYMNLTILAPNSLLFGMHDATGYGVGWSGDDDRSDVKSVCGDYPALFSEDVSQVELGADLDRTRYRLTNAYNGGSVISLVWHQYDPLNRGFYATDVNNERIVSTIIPGGAHHQDYTDKLKKIASFIKTLRGSKGESIPIIFRPYHEHYGNWFWWGPAFATTSEFVTLWQFTASYLHDSLNVHNLIWAISPPLDLVGSGNQYFDIFPGNSFVDIFGSDFYFNSTVSAMDAQNFSRYMRTLVGHALVRSKIAALTEVGQQNLPTVDWFTDVVLAPIKNDTVNTNISYGAVWRNADASQYYAPYPGSKNVPDFLQFYDDPYTLFQKDLPPMYHYPAPDSLPPAIVSKHDSTYVSTLIAVTITVVTNERAYLRYALADMAYNAMDRQFQIGEGGYTHQTAISAHQGDQGTIYVRAKDISGNSMQSSQMIKYVVDTLETPIPWSDSRYPLFAWSRGKTPIGSSGSDSTISQQVRTAYFKRRLALSTVPTALGILVKSYGGAAVYVNSREVGRVNLPINVALAYDIDPTSSGSFNKWFTLDSVALKSLLIGDNALAVEVHAMPQNSVQSFNVQIIDQSNALLLPLGSEWSYFDKGYKPTDVKLRDLLGIAGNRGAVPRSMDLHPNYPNPFNPRTTISYDLAKPTHVKLEVFDILGRRVAVLVDEFQYSGLHTTIFDASPFASGMYVLRMRVEGFQKSHKMLLLK
jgi:mannan endo-1,4-beta-mannosidase